MILVIYKQDQRGIIGRFCMEAAATTHKRLFLNKKSCTGLEVSGECNICLGFLIFKQLNREIQFFKFQPPQSILLFFTIFKAVKYTYNSVQRELALLLDQYCCYL